MRFLSGYLCLSVLLSLLGAGTFAGETNAVVLSGFTTNGTARVVPDEGISGEFGTWTVQYTVGAGGIRRGGGIRVQLPDAWHAGPRNSANRLQSTDPKDDCFVSANASRSGVRVETTVESQTDARLVKHAKPSLDGRLERYVFVVRVRLLTGELRPGDVVSVIYGDRSQGSAGYRASAVSTSLEPILIAVDALGEGRFQLLKDPPTIRARPGDAVEMEVHVPSLAVVGQSVDVLLTLVDKEGNPVERSTRIQLAIRSGRIDVPRRVEIPPGPGYVWLRAVPTATGVIRLGAETEGLELVSESNPMLVSETAPERFIYWGDLHSHSAFSWDGVGHDPYHYARNVSGLDFYALTDHSIAPPDETQSSGLSERTWDAYNALAEAHHDPPHFVTLHAYECSFGSPYGHHNVYFRDQPGTLGYPSKITLPELWKQLDAGDALTIPHHSGKFPAGIDFSIHDARFRRNFEIYSGHGLSEAYDPEHPLSFEHSTFTSPSRSLKPGTYAQDVWMQGLELSTIAASDDHRAHPGQPHLGLAAVRAPALTRNDVFNALYDRHTYGTTGAKIILRFELNNAPMGSLVAGSGIPELKILALGTDGIRKVDLLKFQSPAKQFDVIKTWQPDTLDFEASYRDEAFQPGAVYYVRLEQRHRIRGRAVMAWSSPIFTNP